jgi:NAD(P)-dependent dehydrogenase (short-subunit alcohol dehydrogenase family)
VSNVAGFNGRTTAEQASAGADLEGQHAIVTGANTGIGWETARVLALRGARVTLACRDLEKGEAARARILERHETIPDSSLELRGLDLASLASVRSFADSVLTDGAPIHLLVNNAGVMLNDYRQTSDGFEIHVGINHLGHFLLTTLLAQRLLESAPARVVVVSSDALHFSSLTPDLEDPMGERSRTSGMRAYANSKLMNVLFANELNHRLHAEGVVANSLHPGIVATELGRDQRWYMKAIGLLMLPAVKSPERGAATSVYLATSPEFEKQGGGYFSNCAPAKRNPKLSGDRAAETRLWQWSEQATSL